MQYTAYTIDYAAYSIHSSLTIWRNRFKNTKATQAMCVLLMPSIFSATPKK